MRFVDDWRTLKRVARENPNQPVTLFPHLYFSGRVSMSASAAVAYMRSRLHVKISSHDPRPDTWRNVRNYEQRMSDTAWDRDRIAEYARRIRYSGCRNLLRTPHYKKLYPHIDNQEVSW